MSHIEPKPAGVDAVNGSIPTLEEFVGGRGIACDFMVSLIGSEGQR
jgi:hypothetical protein